MHWIDRGNEPSGLKEIRRRYTPRWIVHYRNGVGSRPTDSRWRDFHDDLKQIFGGICGYCEEICKGEVDHLRPKTRFPQLVYEWSNWILACHDCNHAKGNKWPEGGYVDPCAVSESCRPETYFTFDTKTGEIIPLGNLEPKRFERAATMIDDLNLNSEHHLKNRLNWLRAVTRAILDDPDQETPDSEMARRYLESHSTPWSSLVRVWLVERGYAISD